MSNKTTIKTVEQVNSIRAARYAALYGDDWETKFIAMYGENWHSMSKTERRKIGLPPRVSVKGVYATSFTGMLPARKEFLSLLTVRLLEPKLSDGNFIRLAELYVQVRGWDKPKLKKTECKPEKPKQEEPEIDFNEQIRQLEAAEKE